MVVHTKEEKKAIIKEYFKDLTIKEIKEKEYRNFCVYCGNGGYDWQYDYIQGYIDKVKEFDRENGNNKILYRMLTINGYVVFKKLYSYSWGATLEILFKESYLLDKRAGTSVVKSALNEILNLANESTVTLLISETLKLNNKKLNNKLLRVLDIKEIAI